MDSDNPIIQTVGPSASFNPKAASIAKNIMNDSNASAIEPKLL
jgi:hypothetical protein